MSRIAQVLKQLQAERDRMIREVERLDTAIGALGGTGRDHSGSTTTARSRRRFSAATRRRMAASQRARWVKRNQPKARKPKRAMSQAARNRIATTQRARWAKLKQKRLAQTALQKKSAA